MKLVIEISEDERQTGPDLARELLKLSRGDYRLAGLLLLAHMRMSYPSFNSKQSRGPAKRRYDAVRRALWAMKQAAA